MTSDNKEIEKRFEEAVKRVRAEFEKLGITKEDIDAELQAWLHGGNNPIDRTKARLIARIRSARKNNITHLDLNMSEPERREFDYRITELPPDIGTLTNLQTLSLGNNLLTDLPPEIGRLQNLTSLDLSNNILTTLPPEIGQLNNLSVLNLSHNELTTLPSEIGKLTNLTSLDISENHLASLPLEVGQLKNLKLLNLRFNNFDELPSVIGYLNNLEKLIARGNRPYVNLQSKFLLSSLFAGDIAISDLQLIDNPLLPKIVNEFSGAESKISHQTNTKSLRSIPDQIGELQNLAILDLSGNELKSLPNAFWKLHNLYLLSRSRKRIENLSCMVAMICSIRYSDLCPYLVSLLPLTARYGGQNLSFSHPY